MIIHESRFTYQQKGLHKLVDLGEYWEQTTGHAIPLGGIVVRKSLPVSVKAQIDALIRESLEYAFERYPALPPYVKEHAQEMDESVMRQHIDLYVNQFSIDLGVEGKKAVDRLQQAV
ncbi:MqnA/MqnD/SBP family protein [Chitinophaga sedimenti]|uniref:MqnA/MqnD/SBP family protein n=1 Tax=Chitinophaga sedimenti TaxID=2033606 RepID=UPI0027DF7920|nr:MqnA/MqnD/SBP family protein [Chitinophaga sedimenti]